MIVKLTLEDAIAVAKGMREDDRHALRAMMGAASDEVIAANRWHTEGPAWCFLEDNEPAAMFGLASTAPWSATAWLIATPRLHSWRKLVRHCRTVAANLKDSPLHRVEALVMEDWPAAQRFADRLGFRYEGTKRAAGRKGENLQIWGLIP